MSHGENNVNNNNNNNNNYYSQYNPNVNQNNPYQVPNGNGVYPSVYPPLNNFQMPYPIENDQAVGTKIDTVMSSLLPFISGASSSRTYRSTESRSYSSSSSGEPRVVINNNGPSWWEIFLYSRAFGGSSSHTTNIYNGNVHSYDHNAKEKKKQESDKTALVIVGIVTGVIAVVGAYFVGKDLERKMEVNEARESLGELSQQHEYSNLKNNQQANAQVTAFLNKTTNLLNTIDHNTSRRLLMKVVALVTAIAFVAGCFTATIPLVVASALVFLVDAVSYAVFAGMTSREGRKINTVYSDLEAQATYIKSYIQQPATEHASNF